MNDETSSVTAVVLAGGRGKRVGQNKALLKMGDVYLLEIVLKNIRAIFDNVLLVVSSIDYDCLMSLYFPILSCYCTDVIVDPVSNQGPLLGLMEGLTRSDSEWTFLLGCDMPFVNGSLVRLIYQERTNTSQAIVPRLNGFLEPLHAFYHRSCLPAAESVFRQDKRKIKDFYPLIDLSVIEERKMSMVKNYKLSFFNINTAEDLKMAESLQFMAKKLQRQISR
mgnify:FL=1